MSKSIKLIFLALVSAFLAGCGGGGGGNFTTCADLPTTESVFSGFQEIFANATYYSTQKRIQYHNVTNNLTEYGANLVSNDFNHGVMMSGAWLLNYGYINGTTSLYGKSDDTPSNGISYMAAEIPATGGRLTLSLSSNNVSEGGYDINNTVLGNITDELFDEVFSAVDGCKTGLYYTDSVDENYRAELEELVVELGFDETYIADVRVFEKVVQPFRYVITWSNVLARYRITSNETIVHRLITRDDL